MKKLKLSTFLDGAFIFSLSFFVSYALLKGIIKGIMLTALLSIALSCALTFLFCYFLDKKQNQKDVLLKDKKEFENFLKTLYFYSDSEAGKLVKNYYTSIDIKGVSKNGYLALEEVNSWVFFSFTPEKTRLNAVLNAYKKTPKGVSLIFISNDYDSQVYEFFSGFERVKLYNGKEFYLSLKEKNLLPELKTDIKKPRAKLLFKEIFIRENSKKFFIWGATFTLFSTVTYFKWFYLILGGIFLGISAYLRFFKNFKQTKKAELL